MREEMMDGSPPLDDERSGTRVTLAEEPSPGTPSTADCSGDEEESSEPVRYEELGIDYDIDPDALEIHVHTGRLKEITNLDELVNLQKLIIVASLIQKLSGLDNNVNLEHLELYQAKIRRIENISHLMNLTTLDLSFNGIRTITNISTLVNLENLYLSSNKIGEVPAEEFKHLTKLKYLELGANRIHQVDATCLAQLTMLEQCWLGKNKMSSMQMPLLQNLRVLDMRSNRLTTWDASVLELPNLEELYLSHNQIVDAPEVHFFKNKLPKLTSLDLSANAITTLAPFAHLTNLKELYLSYCNITDDKEVRHLSSLQHLESIYLEHNPFLKNLGPTYRATLRKNCADSLKEIDGNDLPVIL